MPANQITEQIQKSFQQSELGELHLPISQQQLAKAYRIRSNIIEGLGARTTRILAELNSAENLTDYDFKLIRRSFYRTIQSEFDKISTMQSEMRPFALSFLASVITNFNARFDYLIDEFSTSPEQNLCRTPKKCPSLLIHKLSRLFYSDSAERSPRKFDYIQEGIVLKIKPALSDSAGVKFAACYHPYFKDSNFFSELAQFLPQEICFIAAPDKRQNSFSFALNLTESSDYINFKDELRQRGYKQIDPDQSTEAGDIICYHLVYEPFKFSHAGIIINESQVISRWGQAGPVVLHPLKHLPPELMRANLGDWKIYRIQQS